MKSASGFRVTSLVLFAAWSTHLVQGQEQEEFRATLKIEGGLARRGAEVTLPIVINANSYLQGLSFSVDFDEEVLEATGFEPIFRRVDGKDWHLAVFLSDNHNTVPGNGGVEEGYMVGGVMFYVERVAWTDHPLPDTDNPILGLKFRVKPDAPLGPTEIRFLDGGIIHPRSPPVTNVVTLVGVSADLTFQVSPLLVHGLLGIVDDISLFVRGDSNDDLRVDVSDAVATLGFLFLGSARPRCMDAADANDDGRIDVSDPVATIHALFLGSQPLPPPRGSPGEDPTPEDPYEC